MVCDVVRLGASILPMLTDCAGAFALSDEKRRIGGVNHGAVGVGHAQTMRHKLRSCNLKRNLFIYYFASFSLITSGLVSSLKNK